MSLNPSAIVFWVLCAAVGLGIWGTLQAAALCLAVGIGLSLIATALL
jgi:hypothetical protein